MEEEEEEPPDALIVAALTGTCIPITMGIIGHAEIVIIIVMFIDNVGVFYNLLYKEIVPFYSTRIIGTNISRLVYGMNELMHGFIPIPQQGRRRATPRRGRPCWWIGLN